MKRMQVVYRLFQLLTLLILLCGCAGVHAEEYRLGAGDTITVSVIDHPEFGGTVQVAADGTVRLPVVAQQPAAGYTINELTQKLRTAYTTRLVDPEVYVTLAAGQEQNVYLLGAVKAPGKYALKPGMGALELMLAANALPQDLADCSATLLRKSAKGPTPLDLEKILRGVGEANVSLENGDVLLVVTRRKVSVYVTGDVEVPGLYEVPEQTTISQALALARGARGNMQEKQLVLLRGKDITTVALSTIFQLDAKADIAVQKGDILRVESSMMTIQVSGEVSAPASYTVKRGLGVIDCFTFAGGMTPTARSSAVTVSHNDGTQETVNIPALVLNKGNFPLRDGDHVTVPSSLMSITLSGDVKLPGTYRISPQTSMTDLLALAGGVTEHAALGHVTITHLDGNIEHMDAASHPAQPQHLVWREGDRIIIPTITDQITVLGNVRSPGYYPIETAQPYRTSDAILRAGGLAENSSIRHITVTRMIDGKSTKIKTRLTKTLHPKHLADDPLLMPGDTVYVPQASGVKLADVLSVLSLASLIGTYVKL